MRARKISELINQEKIKKYYRDYYIKNRVRLCEKRVEVYMSNAIKKIGVIMPDEISKLYDKYPFEVYGDPYLDKTLKIYGVRQNELAFAECYEAAMMGYIYSIHRCAYMGYTHTENYIKFMIRCFIRMGLVLANKERYAMQSENYEIVYLDDEANRNRF